MEWGFVLDTIERTVRTAVQSAAAAVLVLWIDAGSFGEISWSKIWQVAAFASGLTILTALASKGAGDPDSASMLKPEEDVSP